MSRHIAVAAQNPELKKRIAAILAQAGIESGVCGMDGKAHFLAGAQALLLEYSPLTWNCSANVIARWREQRGQAPVILIAADSSEQAAVRALRMGVAEYVHFPENIETLPDLIHALAPRLATTSPESSLVGSGDAMEAMREQIRKVARRDSNVLITGETGTGKEVVAQAIHDQSLRAGGPFVCVNCAAIPDGLLESELFGYERGAFTGAQAASEGKIRLAHGGSLFLDEVGEMSPFAQAKILRVIDTHEVWPLGAKRSSHADVRIIAATNRPIDPVAHAKEFRPDLYYRLSTTHIHLPPLRERAGDIPALLKHFTAEFNSRFQSGIREFSEEAMAAMLRYDWPGNIRELRNVVESACANLSSSRVELADLPAVQRPPEHTSPGERARLVDALSATNWNVSSAAQKLHWSRMTIYRKMAKYQVVKQPKSPPRMKAAGGGA